MTVHTRIGAMLIVGAAAAAALVAAACATTAPAGLAALDSDLIVRRPASVEADPALRSLCGPARRAAAAQGGRIYLDAEVDWPAGLGGPPVAAVHPGVAGSVVLEFVLDTLGQVERETIRPVEPAHQAVIATAVDAVLRSRYTPGRLNGRPIRLCVQQPYSFGYGAAKDRSR